MNQKTLLEAEAAAKVFLERAKVVHAAWQQGKEHTWLAPKETGALRRASMDLTRALAELRKPG